MVRAFSAYGIYPVELPATGHRTGFLAISVVIAPENLFVSRLEIKGLIPSNISATMAMVHVVHPMMVRHTMFLPFHPKKMDALWLP